MACRGFESICTNDEARKAFADKGLSYEQIHEENIRLLMSMLEKEIRKSNETGETSVDTIKLSSKYRITTFADGHIKKCFLFMDSHYFNERECISFDEDGFIGFAGWADIGNLNPIKRAFLAWCDILEKEKKQ